MPANCINTTGPFAPGVAEWFYAFVKSLRMNGKCECSIRCDRESRFYRKEGGGHERYRGAINSDKLYYPRYILSRMKSSGPCLRPCRPPLRDQDILLPSLLFSLLRSPTVGTCTPVIADEGDMRLVSLERKRCRFLHAIFLAPPAYASSLSILLSSPFSIYSFSLPPPHPCSLDTRYQPPFLYSANVFPIFLLRSTCA